jgi:aryl-alcohol dehydrogenase-like predicted oxidoreductase
MRERVKISTKFGAEPRDAGDWPASRTGLSRDAIRTQFESSLRRLGTDHVELAWAHMEDRSVPIEKTAEAMAELVSEGRAGRIGTSNHPAWRVERARAHARSLGIEPITALQHSRTFLQTRPGIRPPAQNHRFGVLTDELLDLARVEDLEIWAYTALLSGAYDNPAKSFEEVYDHPAPRRLAVLDEVAAETGLTRGQVVLSWLAGSTPVTRPILGGSKLDQLDAALVAVAYDLPAELRARLDAVEREQEIE